MNVRVRGRARGHGVKIIGETRDLNESLPSAGGASVVIRVLRSSSIERDRDQLRLHNRLMHGAIRKIGDLLGMSESEHAASARIIGPVSRVVGSGGVTLAQGRRHCGVTDGPGPSTIAHHLKLSIPVFGW